MGLVNNKSLFAVFGLTLISVASTISAQESATKSAKYKYGVQAGDVLEISVWKEEGLQTEVLVTPDGELSFPLAGHISANGKSLKQLEDEISKRIEKYISDPVVSVQAKQLLGNRIYVIGKVNKPGEFIVNRYVDVMQVLSMAGGMTPFSAVNNIKVLRRKGDQQQVFEFEYSDVEKGKNLEQNIILRSGDVVVVP